MSRFLLTTAFVVVACGVATAQRQPGGNRPAGGMGAASLAPQVVSNKDLQADLKVTDAQKEKFKDPAAKLADVQKKQRDLFGAGGGGARPDMTKMQEVRVEMTKVNEEVTKVVTDTLTDDQKARLKQIEVQRMGLRAFTNADVVKELALTDDQKAKIKTITDDLAKELGAGAGGRPGAGGAGGRGGAGARPMADPEAAKKRSEATAKALEKATGELTDAQKTTFKKLTGEKFDLTKLNTFGRAPMRPDM